MTFFTRHGYTQHTCPSSILRCSKFSEDVHNLILFKQRNLTLNADKAVVYDSGFFIKHKRELTTLPVQRYSSGHRKGRLKILYDVGS